jgi:hypothetical protein
MREVRPPRLPQGRVDQVEAFPDLPALPVEPDAEVTVDLPGGQDAFVVSGSVTCPECGATFVPGEMGVLV